MGEVCNMVSNKVRGSWSAYKLEAMPVIYSNFVHLLLWESYVNNECKYYIVKQSDSSNDHFAITHVLIEVVQLIGCAPSGRASSF